MVRRSGSEFVSAQRAEELFAEAELFDTLDRVRNRTASVDTRAAVSPRRVEAHRDTPAPVPSPLAINAVVITDLANRTLYCRLPDHTTGLQRTAWARAYSALQTEDAGYNTRMPTFWASTRSAEKVARGAAAEAEMVKFFFPVGAGNGAFGELVGRVGLYAITTVDREQGWFMRCSFLHRPG